MAPGKKRERLEELLAEQGPVLVSYSGGVDSGLLAVLASRLSGGRARCVLLDSPVISRRVIREAVKTAREHGFHCEIVPFSIVGNEDFRKNPKNRCFLCRKASAKILKERAAETGCTSIADGINTSDFSQYRPGIRASEEEGLFHPFVEAGMAKDDIRQVARDLGLPFWEAPSDACLASRIPYGEEITSEKLRRIEEAEDFLIAQGFTRVRVRSHGGIARIEVDQVEIGRISEMRAEISKALKAMGFSYVTLDLEGFRSGSMDEVL